MVYSQIVDLPQKTDTAFEKFEIIGRFEINTWSCDPGCVDAHIRVKAFYVVPWRIVERAAKPLEMRILWQMRWNLFGRYNQTSKAVPLLHRQSRKRGSNKSR